MPYSKSYSQLLVSEWFDSPLFHRYIKVCLHQFVFNSSGGGVTPNPGFPSYFLCFSFLVSLYSMSTISQRNHCQLACQDSLALRRGSFCFSQRRPPLPYDRFIFYPSLHGQSSLACGTKQIWLYEMFDIRVLTMLCQRGRGLPPAPFPNRHLHGPR